MNTITLIKFFLEPNYSFWIVDFIRRSCIKSKKLQGNTSELKLFVRYLAG